MIAAERSTGTDRIRKRAVVLNRHRTSISLEDDFWAGLLSIAGARKVSVNALVAEIDKAKFGGLSSAVRLFVLRDALSGKRRRRVA